MKKYNVVSKIIVNYISGFGDRVVVEADTYKNATMSGKIIFYKYFRILGVPIFKYKVGEATSDYITKVIIIKNKKEEREN